jgi:hypothetical protein
VDDPRFPLLPHLPAAAIRACYENAPGNEIESGKLASPRSSAALAANAWGFFITQPETLPRLPGLPAIAWPPLSVTLEQLAPFPWAGGHKPCLDVWIETEDAIIGVESKRYEPFDAHKATNWSDAYWRPVWGERLVGYCSLRDRLRDEPKAFTHLDAGQLVKHAFGLRTAAHRTGRRAFLFYVFAEPSAWPDGAPIPQADINLHRSEVAQFAAAVADDEVWFASISYRDLIAQWSTAGGLREHAAAVATHFKP